MLSRKTRYAIMSLVYLAKRFEKGPVQISEIASSETIPQRFLENILLDMRNMGILGSRMGKSGGYYLLKQPSQILLSDIVCRFEGSISMLHCVSENAYQPCEFCKDETSCKIRRVFKTIRDQTFNILGKTSLADLI